MSFNLIKGTFMFIVLKFEMKSPYETLVEMRVQSMANSWPKGNHILLKLSIYAFIHKTYINSTFYPTASP